MTESNDALIQSVAERLQETEALPCGLIRGIVTLCGAAFTELMVDSALVIYEGEGMMTNDGKRQRTLGGVFFYLVRGALPADLRNQIFIPPNKRTQQPRFPNRPAFNWETRQADLKRVLNKKKGKVTDVHINIKGRPAHVEYRSDVVVVALEDGIGDNGFPKGVPQPKDTVTTYYVYIGANQWQKGKGKQLEQDKKLHLAVEGVSMLDEELNGIVVLARSFKTFTPKQKKEKPPAPMPEDEPVETEVEPDLSAFPADVAQKLRSLYGARRMFRKRLADIEALPEDQQSGLKAAQMMVERTEQQIAALEKDAGRD